MLRYEVWGDRAPTLRVLSVSGVALRDLAEEGAFHAAFVDRRVREAFSDSSE